MRIEFDIQKSDNCTSLIVEGDLTAQNGKVFKSQLQKLLNEDSTIELSLGEIERIDVSALQLIRAFKQLTTSSQKKLQIIPPDNADVIQLLTRTGLLSILQS